MGDMKTENENPTGKTAEGGCIDPIKEFDGVVPAHLDKLVTLHTVREWFCTEFQYSEQTFKCTHLKELDRNYFRAYFGAWEKKGDEGKRLRPSADRFYKSRVIWWLIERKKNPIPRRREAQDLEGLFALDHDPTPSE